MEFHCHVMYKLPNITCVARKRQAIQLWTEKVCEPIVRPIGPRNFDKRHYPFLPCLICYK